MKKITLWLFALFGMLQMNAQEFSIQNCSPSLFGSNMYGPMFTTGSLNAANRMAVIYPAGQLVSIAGQTLNTIYAERYSDGSTISGTPNFRVLLKEVAVNDWGSDALNWETATAGATEVYNSNPAAIVGSTSGWKAFPMSNTFVYSGTQNLAVFFEYSNAVSSGNITWKTDTASPCLVAGSTNATKYTNVFNGILPENLSSSVLRRPIIGFDYVNTCSTPSNVQINSLTPNSVGITWTPGDSENLWEYAITEPGQPITMDALSASTNSVNSISLNPNTSYEIYVRAVCSSESTSAWVSSGVFSTPCSLVTSFFENFDTYATGTSSPLPDCWGELGTGNVYIITGSVSPNSTPNRLSFTVSNTQTEALAILPSVSNLQAGTHRLKFSISTTVSGNEFEIGYLTDLTDKESFVLLESMEIPATSSASAGTHFYTPTDIPAGIQNLVLRNYAPSGSKTFYIDDLVWEETPACADVSNLTFNNATDTSVTIGWTPGSDETAWQYVYANPTVVNPYDLTPVDVTQNSVATISNLISYTKYKIWVRSTCPTSGYGVWVGPLLVQTTCTPVSEFYESFDSYATGSNNPLPDCWSKGGNSSLYINSGSSSPNSAPNRLLMNGSETANSFAVMPVVNNLQADTHRLRFKAYASLEESSLLIGYLETPNDFSTFTELESAFITTTTSATAQEFIFEIVGVPSGINSLVLANIPAPQEAIVTTVIYVDDVYWEAIPDCADITSVTLNSFTDTTAGFSWTADDVSVSDWQYVYAMSDVTNPDTLTPIDVSNTTSTILSNLEALTDYKIWIRTNCGSGEYGLWSSPIVFQTLCTPVTDFFEDFESYPAAINSPLPTCWSKAGTNGVIYINNSANSSISGANSLYMFANSGMPSIVNAVLPPVSNLQAETHRLRFKAYATASDRTIDVGYFSEPIDPTSFVTIETINLPSTTAFAAQEFVVTPTDIPDGINNLVFRNVGYDLANFQTTAYVDDISWESIPSCPDVTNLGINSLTSTSVALQWDDNDSEAGWQYVYSIDSTVNPATLTPTDVTVNPSAILSNLEPITEYTYWVRSNCGNGEYGSWSQPFAFTTTCSLVTEFSENFDGYTAGSTNPLPNCWDKAGTGTSYIISGSTSPQSSPNKLYFNANGTASTPTVAYLILPPVSNLQAETHRLKFTAYATSANKFIQVGYLGDSGDLSTFEVLETLDMPTLGLGGVQMFIINPINIPDGVNSLVIKNTGPNGLTTVYIDDVAWEPIPTCPDLTGLNLISTTNTTALISWDVLEDETAWQYAYTAEASVNDPATLTVYDTTENPTTITDLVATTSYKVWVRVKCGETYGAWSLPMTFTTLCTPITTLPWNEGFENMTSTGTAIYPYCWLEEVNTWASTSATATLTPNSGTKYITSADGTSLLGSFIWTPSFYLIAGENYTFSFFAQGDGWNDWVVDLYYNTSQNSTDAISFGNTYNAPGVGSASPQEYEQVSNTLSVPTTGVYYIGVAVTRTQTNAFAIGFDDFSLDNALGNESFDSTSFKAYPNPVHNILNLSYTETISDVEVFNLLGQKVLVTNLNAPQGQVNMSSLATGTYLVKVTSGNQIKTLKVLKQ